MKQIIIFYCACSPYSFLRTHQSRLINLDEVKSFVKTGGGCIRMKDNTSIPISRQLRSVVLERLSRLRRYPVPQILPPSTRITRLPLPLPEIIL